MHTGVQKNRGVPILEAKPKILKAVVRDGWALCPRCWGKLCRVTPGAKARGVILWCKRDKEIELTTEP